MHHDSLVPREWFGKVSMQRINVLSIQRISADDRGSRSADRIDRRRGRGDLWGSRVVVSTSRRFGQHRFAAMKAVRVLINVARGEIVDEEALADALQRDHLRGAALDVYVGEFEHTPMSRLWSDPRVLITPHISSASDQDRHGAINLFCDNLRAYLEGGPLRNVI